MRINEQLLCYSHATRAMEGQKVLFVMPDDPGAAKLTREVIDAIRLGMSAHIH
jgi:hypothetical protein